jgi:hypothetical protein
VREKSNFQVTHAEGIRKTETELVAFLREGDIPNTVLRRMALYIYVCNRVTQNAGRPPVPAGRFFEQVVEDGIADCLEAWDNPKKYAALETCPVCDGEGRVPKATGIIEINGEVPASAPKKRRKNAL